ncbi:hypothetical protein D9M73_252740 [compost metagenome]
MLEQSLAPRLDDMSYIQVNDLALLEVQLLKLDVEHSLLQANLQMFGLGLQANSLLIQQ